MFPNFNIVLVALLVIIPTITIAQTCDTVGKPESFYFVVTNNLGVATWYAPTESQDCDLQYHVEYLINGVVIEDFLTDREFHVFDRVKLCSTVEVRITTIDVNDAENTSDDPEIRTDESEIATISNLQLVDGVATWDVPLYSDACRYEIKLDDDTLSTVTDNEYAVQQSIPGCSQQKLIVVPKHNNLEETGESININFESGLEITEIKQEASTLIWETSADEAEECVFTLEFDNGDPISVKGTTYDLSESDLKPCIQHGATVAYAGSEKSITVDIEPGELEDFQVDYDTDGKIVATWSEKFDNCQVLITVDGQDEQNYGNSPAELDENFFKFCETYAISARATDTDDVNSGSTVRDNFKRTIDALDTFIIEQMEGVVFVATWDDNYAACAVTITVEPVDEPFTELTNSYAELGDLEINFCQSYSASLRIDDTDYFEAPTETTFYKTIADITTDQITFEEENNEITVTWPDTYEKCNVDITLDGESIIANILSATTAELDTSKLTFCVLNTATLELAFETSFSASQNFDIIIAGALEDFKVTSNDDGEIVASWPENFNECNIEVEIAGDIYTVTSENTILVGFSPSPCIDYIITAYTYIDDDHKGLPTTTSHLKDTTLEETAFRIHQDTGYISSTWLEGFDTCAFEIIVLLSPEYLVIESLVKDAPIDIAYCTTHSIIARLMLNDLTFGIDQVMLRQDFTPPEKFDVIEEMSLTLIDEKVNIKWEKSETVTSCGISYEMYCNNSDNDADSATETITNDETEYTFACEIDVSTTMYTLSITPQYDATDGAVIVCDYEIDRDDTDTVSLKLIDTTSSTLVCPESNS